MSALCNFDTGTGWKKKNWLMEKIFHRIKEGGGLNFYTFSKRVEKGSRLGSKNGKSKFCKCFLQKSSPKIASVFIFQAKKMNNYVQLKKTKTKAKICSIIFLFWRKKLWFFFPQNCPGKFCHLIELLELAKKK